MDEQTADNNLKISEEQTTAPIPMTDSYPLLRRRVNPAPASSRCAGCGSAEVAALPSFSVGCGVVYREIADDVFCRHCGHIGSPTYKIRDAKK